MTQSAEQPTTIWLTQKTYDRLSAELELDRERVRGWTIVHTLAWSVAEGQVFTNQVEVVRWLLDG